MKEVKVLAGQYEVARPGVVVMSSPPLAAPKAPIIFPTQARPPVSDRIRRPKAQSCRRWASSRSLAVMQAALPARQAGRPCRAIDQRFENFVSSINAGPDPPSSTPPPSAAVVSHPQLPLSSPTPKPRVSFFGLDRPPPASAGVVFPIISAPPRWRRRTHACGRQAAPPRMCVLGQGK